MIHLRNRDYGLVEIKLGGDKLIEIGSETLKESLQTVEDSLMNMLDGEIAQIYDMDENLVEIGRASCRERV